MKSVRPDIETTLAQDPAHAAILARLRGNFVAAMLYGSRARGDARADSDVDVVQVVAHATRSYSVENLNVSTYTVSHLVQMADRGSLFVRHLRDEGITLADATGTLRRILASYREPASYDALRRELAVVVSALRLPGADKYEVSARKVAAFSVRSLMYAECADAGVLEFDVLKASAKLHLPEIGTDLRSPESTLGALLRHASDLLTRSGVEVPIAPSRDFEEVVVWCGVNFPAAAVLLESVLVDDPGLDYTSLTLPMS